jgi:adenosylcobinamide-GDP ribazoletransferase
VKAAWNGWLLALQFFTVMPIKKQIPMHEIVLKRSLQLYPLVGAAFGLIIACLAWLLQAHTPVSTAVTAFLLLTLSVIFTGGLHLDGWMDCSDAYFSYRDRKKRLEIMKDPRVGSFAVLSVLFLLGWRYLLIFETIGRLSGSALLLIAVIPFLSRVVMGSVFIFGKPAKSDGLAAFFKKGLAKTDVWIYVVYVAIWFALASSFAVLDFILLLAALAVVWLCARWIRRQFGGLTGDTLGATLEGAETWLWLILWLLLAFGTA